MFGFGFFDSVFPVLFTVMFVLILGVIIAMAVVIIIYLTNDTIKVEEDVERYLGLSVLGSIPYSEKESRSKKQKARKRR